MAQSHYYIDPALHVSSIPSTYVPPGNVIAAAVAVSEAAAITASNASTYILIGNVEQGLGGDMISGYFTMGATATFPVVIPVGFAPGKISIVDWTTYVEYEWRLGAPATNTLKRAASTTYNSVDTGTAITVTTDSDGGLGDVTYVTLKASLFSASDVVSFRIEQ